jgi:hypothetical protein
VTRRLTEEKKRKLRMALKAWWDSIMAEDHSAFDEQIRRLK